MYDVATDRVLFKFEKKLCEQMSINKFRLSNYVQKYSQLEIGNYYYSFLLSIH